MKRSPSAYLSPLAALVTLGAASLLNLAGAEVAAGEPAGGTVSVLWLPVAAVVPLAVAVLWGLAAWGDRRTWRLVGSLAAWLGSGYLLVQGPDMWSMTANVAAGLVAGLAWRHRWRPDVALVGAAAVLAPLVIWAAVQMPVRDQLAAISDQSLKALEQRAPPNTDPAELAKAREVGQQRFAQLTDMTLRLYPSLIATGLLGQALVILLLVRVAGRRQGLVPVGWGLPPFARWRLPFYLVWALAAGIGLLVTRRAPWADVGLNLTVLAAAILSVQGLAVQFHLSRRLLPPVGLVAYWTLMGLAFVPLLATSALLGLADQWRDLRRLDSGEANAGSQ